MAPYIFQKQTMCGKVASPGTLGMATTSRIIKTVQPKNWKNVEFGRRTDIHTVKSDSPRRRGVSPSSRRSVPALARGFRICATLQLLAPPSKQAPARGRLWPQARGAGLRGNLMSVSGVLPRLLDPCSRQKWACSGAAVG